MPRVSGDVASERFVLASLAQNGLSALLPIAHILDDNCFFDTSNKLIYKILSSAINRLQNVDVTTFMAEAHNLGLSSILEKKENQLYINTLFNTHIHVENLQAIVVKLKKLAITYQAQLNLEQAHRELTEINGTEPIDHIMSLVEKPYNDIGQMDSDDNMPVSLFDGMIEHIDSLIDNPCSQVGISSGMPMYDFMIGGGFRPGYINLIVARPKSGKSLFGLNVAYNVSQQNIPVLYLDTEMEDNLQKNRLLSAITNIDPNKIETGHFIDRRDYVKQKIQKCNKNLFYKRIAGKPFDEVLSIIRRWIHRYKKNDCLIVYDYFKLMDSGDLNGMSEHQALGFQLSKLTDYLGNNKIGCLAFVQANRDGISKDTTDIVSQSDRLTWLCASLALLRKKTGEEIAQEGIHRGDRKLIPMDAMRFSAGLADKDWINLALKNFRFIELGTNQNPSGQFIHEDQTTITEIN